MAISNKKLSQINQLDLQSLIDNQIPEGRTIEYKESLPGRGEPDKKEFLADVTSFCNSSGGDIIYGIREEAGLPTSLIGIENTQVDFEMQRLNNMILESVDPRIPGLSIQPVQINSSKSAIIIRIPRSWALPHMVKQSGRFYSRKSNGKYALDVSEIRGLFSLSENITQRIKSFRFERMSAIIENESVVRLGAHPKIVFHSVPLSAFDPTAKYDLSWLEKQNPFLQPLSATSWRGRYNFDGFLSYSNFGEVGSYIQVFRNGIVEAIDDFFLRPREELGKIIPAQPFEELLIWALPRFLQIQRILGVDTPMMILLSLVGVAGYRVAAGPYVPNSTPIDRDILVLPEVLLEGSLDKVHPPQILQPAFDAIWNASGFPRSLNYNESGKWIGSKRN
jgi:hypothetical protein